VTRHQKKRRDRRRAAERQRRTRARQRAGLVSVRLDIHEDDFAEALIRAGRLSEDESAQLPLVVRELNELVSDFVARWPSPVTGR
jgi:hypothetical protein